MEIDVVHFNPEGDEVVAMYINGEIYGWGDYYHDKINDFIDGFIQGLKFAKLDIIRADTNISYNDNYSLVEDIVEMGGSPPQLFEELGV